MIVNSVCQTCFQTFNLLIQASDVDLVKQVSDESGMTCPCPRLCGGKINLVGDPVSRMVGKKLNLREPLSLTGKELYQAVNGLGLADELPKNKETIEALLKANKVVKVEVEEYNGRFYLHELHLENGLTIHTTSGLRGAQVLKITKGEV